VFEYEPIDIRTKYDWREDIVGTIFPRYLRVAYVIEYVKCPDCGKEIEIRSYRLRDKYIGGLI
jgi:NMD protein affecting ribosome stability and mRNA decay